MRKNLLLAVLFVGAVSYAQECTPVATLDENFNTFTSINPGTDFPQNCWTKIIAGQMIYVDGDAGNNYATYYASGAPTVDAFLISPELTTLSGNYQLSFDTRREILGPPPAAGTVTIQLGTLSDNTDAETFIAFGEPIAVTEAMVNHANIAITAAAGQKYIAFKIVADTPHNAAVIDNVIWNEIPVVCEAVGTINEDFTSFTEDELPQNCWLNIANGPMVYVDSNEEATDRFATFYSFMSANVSGYLITPELTASESDLTLQFDASKTGAGVVTIQVGSITDVEDTETFTAIGNLIILTETDGQQTVTLPAFATAQRIAFKFTADTAHHAAYVDNVVISPTLGVDTVIKNTSFAIYPNPSINKTVTVAATENGNISIYSLTGAKVFETKTSTNSQELNLSNLNAGLYIVKFEAGNATVTKKLVIQ